LEEVFEKVGDKLSKHTIAEKVDHFVKYGNLFLFFELMSLKREIEKIKEEVRIATATATT